MYQVSHSATNAVYRNIELTSRLEVASPHGLVVILYDELLQAVDVTMSAMRRGNKAACKDQHDRAQRILMALSGGLDEERGGQVATTLRAIYGSMMVKLRAAVDRNDGDQVAEIRGGIAALSASWRQLA